MDKHSSILIKSDISEDGAIEIATYKTIGPSIGYRTYKNAKAIAWSTDIEGAMENHWMYVRVQILKVVEENTDVPKYYSETKGEKRDNTFPPGHRQ